MRNKKVLIIILIVLGILGYILYYNNIFSSRGISEEDCRIRGGEVIGLQDQIETPITGKIIDNIKNNQSGSLCVM